MIFHRTLGGRLQPAFVFSVTSRRRCFGDFHLPDATFYELSAELPEPNFGDLRRSYREGKLQLEQGAPTGYPRLRPRFRSYIQAPHSGRSLAEGDAACIKPR